MSADLILGPMGTPLPADVGVLLADADAAATLEQVRWSRAACVITRGTGNLLRAVDTGHAAQYLGFPVPGTVSVAGAACSVCGQEWPCPSSRLERMGPAAREAGLS